MCDKKYEQELTLKQYEILRDYIKHEDSLINNRLTWLLVAQGLIFSAFSSLFKPISDLTSSCDENPDLLILISQMKTIQSVLIGLGLLICIISFLSIRAAVLAIGELENGTLAKIIQKKDPFLPGITGGGSSQPKIFGKIAPWGIPLTILLAWLVVFILSFFPNYKLWVSLSVGFILGSTLTIWVYWAKGNIKE